MNDEEIKDNENCEHIYIVMLQTNLPDHWTINLKITYFP